ncbi:bifunctional diguanylate cyclase/phosphodiesterase [Cellulomonas sp. KRMCY2]|uniref:putative bifunctional diguanylate cyclase/phosphodiesterase n=1 Tax=Cellulomonas sp. KRMCY2 TaxID=1304865 RepID=UPI0004B4040C|nr:bifunctional diguanylate cyclase/phosphodiesterase [Cellulomonas sp. KRMCY2]
MTPPRTQGWRWFAAVGFVVVVVELLMPYGPARDLVYVAIGLASVTAIVIGIRLNRPRRRLPWVLLAVGLGLWVAGDALWAWFDHVVQIDPFPSGADLFYLAAYPVLAGALYQLARGRNAPRDFTSLVDALIVGVAVGLVLWVAFIEPGWTDPEGSLLERVVGVAYPIGDAMLVIQMVHLGTTPLVRTPALRLLGAGFVLTLVTDLIFQAATYVPVLERNSIMLDPGWLTAYLLIGAAVLHPAMPALADGRSRSTGAFTLGRVLFLTAATLVLPGVIIVETILGLPLHTTQVSVASVVLVVLVLFRMVQVVTRMRTQAERLAHLADSDFLTGLDNRRRFTERIDDHLETAGSTPGTSAVLLVGLERFSEVREGLGHHVGDELLIAVAELLQRAVGPAVRVARVGGEDFGILLTSAPDGAAVLAIATDLHDLLARPVTAGRLSITVEGAVGIVLAPHDGLGDLEGLDAEALLQRADLALSAAGERTERVACYDLQMLQAGALAPVLMAELLDAMATGDVVVHYQPQVELGTGVVFGVEALVRWQHPDHGLIPPMAFVPAAERTGLIRELTQYVLDCALAQCAVWRGDGLNLTVAVNLSVRNLLDVGLVDDVRSALVRHGLPPSSLELEITETMAMVDPLRSDAVLGELDDLGVTLSVDDYGTGYGSLAYLQRLPVRRLKIDRSFVAGVVDDPASAAIVRSTIELARALGLSVVAEGVEDDETMMALVRMHCYAAQGFGLGRPVAAEAIPELIERIEGRLPGLVVHDVPAQRHP